MASKTITLTLLHISKTLSFDLDNFSSDIGLEPSDDCVFVPPKETVKAGPATLGLVDEDHPSFSSSALINSSPMKSLLPLSREVYAIDTADKIIQPSSTHATHIQRVEDFVVTADATKSLDASESAEVQGNQPETADAAKVTVLNIRVTASNHSQTSLGKSGEVMGYPRSIKVSESALTFQIFNVVEEEDIGVYSLEKPTFEQLMDEVDKQYKANQEETEKIVQTNDANITFLGSVPITMELDDSGSSLHSMPSDDLTSLTGFETPGSNDEESNSVTKEHSTDNLNATSDGDFVLPNTSVGVLALSDPLGHLRRELRTISSKVDQLDSLITKFVLFQKELSKVIKTKLSKSVRERVRSGMQYVNDRLSSVQDAIAHNTQQTALIVHPSEKENSKDIISGKKDSEDEPPTKKLKVLIPTPDIPMPTPLSSLIPKHLLNPLQQNLFVEQDPSKGKGVVIKEPMKELIPYIEEGGSDPKMQSLKPFVTLEEILSQEDIMAQLKEMKRLAELKAENEKSKASLKKMFNLTIVRAQA
ncbi:hypothetical protein Tco_1062234 [Tanacetum coccineum]